MPSIQCVVICVPAASKTGCFSMLQVRQKRGTWRLPSDDTPVERKRRLRQNNRRAASQPRPITPRGGSGFEADADATPQSQRSGLSAGRRPPPISIPLAASRLPIVPLEGEWSAEKEKDPRTAAVAAAQSVNEAAGAGKASDESEFHDLAPEDEEGSNRSGSDADDLLEFFDAVETADEEMIANVGGMSSVQSRRSVCRRTRVLGPCGVVL